MVRLLSYSDGTSQLGLIFSLGNFHALLLFRTDEELAVARELVHRMVERAIALDGTCKI
jgi:hypothetical protein